MVPPSQPSSSVHVWQEDIVLPTYEPLPPDKNPMFLEKRVYQGSSGKVYPLPFYDRISEEKTDRTWKGVWIENDLIRVLILPEIGGRIHVGQDRTNGYDFFYRQEVIKPALVGLAGPWISGGVEFNWPQHHRPATFMPVEVEIENHEGGAITVWCGDHDPLARMKGMHGICLHPGKAFIELKVRAYNRTQSVQTFLWWANVGTRVHASYQSFFPPDVSYVADHARRSMSEYPLCQGKYYGVDYAERAKHGVPTSEVPSHYVPPHCGGKAAVDYAPNDLSFYSNIPVPTSYMCMDSEEDFFGGYDHQAQAGVVHVANHHISPGKKQWTWGNHDFGYAWDRNLTDADAAGEFAPYIEIMAGVYTDNQPDFSFLMPGETKTWSQFWYPIRKIGPAQQANINAALSFRREKGVAHVGIAVSSSFGKATLELLNRGKSIAKFTDDLVPGAPWMREIPLPKGTATTNICFRVLDVNGRVIIDYQPKQKTQKDVPPPATEPPLPHEIANSDELYLTGLHLWQYRHATRDPSPYWQEALKRDPGDARCNCALGSWHLQRGEWQQAETHLRQAISRLTARNANPYDGEPFYLLGQVLRHENRDQEAYAAFYKATWNHAWQSAGYHALAELDCKQANWETALDHLNRSLRVNTDHLNARNLRTLVLRKLHRHQEAETFLAKTRKLDPLDNWSRHLSGEALSCDAQTHLDIALDYARAGLYEEATHLLRGAQPGAGTAPLLSYYLGWLQQQLGKPELALSHFRAAAEACPDYCFPARAEEIHILQAAISCNPRDARAPYYLGNLFYDRKRHREAIALWEQSAKLGPHFSCVWRNLGIGYFNITRQTAKACAAYDKACAANREDARLLYERDQLWKRVGKKPEKRLRELEKYPHLVRQRDDLTVEYCGLQNQLQDHSIALATLSTRKFQPWEGGEGQVLGQYVRTHLALGQSALRSNDATKALAHFQQALNSPANLSEAKHLLVNQSNIHYWLGIALEKLGNLADAKQHWKLSAEFRGDFQKMSVCAFSEMTYYSAQALRKLRQTDLAHQLLRDLLSYAKRLSKTPAKIDYFATSLPTLLLFDDDLQFRQETTALFLQGQALLGLGKKTKARACLLSVLDRDPNHPFAKDFLAEFHI